jgi:uncharacterized spore protein YtfJ
MSDAGGTIAGSASGGGSAMLADVLGRLSRINEQATVKTAFGDPIHENGRTIIPVAAVAYGFGFGGGRGRGEAEESGGGTGEGAGGAGGVSVRPIAILEIRGEETKVRPVLDVTRLILAGIVFAAWNVFWITLTIRAVAKSRR